MVCFISFGLNISIIQCWLVPPLCNLYIPPYFSIVVKPQNWYIEYKSTNTWVRFLISVYWILYGTDNLRYQYFEWYDISFYSYDSSDSVTQRKPAALYCWYISDLYAILQLVLSEDQDRYIKPHQFLSTQKKKNLLKLSKVPIWVFVNGVPLIHFMSRW